MEKMADTFENVMHNLERCVSIHLSELTTLKQGKKIVSDEMKETGDYGELLEFRNEITGNVFDFYPISILPDGQIEAYDTEGEPLAGDPVNIKQLPLDSRISLIRILEEM